MDSLTKESKRVCACKTCECDNPYCDGINPICDMCKIGSHLMKKYWKSSRKQSQVEVLEEANDI